MRTAFCTIITPDYLHYALALRRSLRNFHEEFPFFIMSSAGDEIWADKIEANYQDTFVFLTAILCNDGIGKKIYEKYFEVDMNAFRWSMKPVLINFLLQSRDFDKVIFLDADLYFFSDYQFLLERLDAFDLLLSPDWRASNPHADAVNFIKLNQEGIYNGGFVGATKQAIKAMDWWAEACEYLCMNDPCRGIYYDQGYLNLLPVYFQNVDIIEHKGCNVANWNLVECYRSKTETGEVLVAGKWPVVFVHFSSSSVRGILEGEDPLLYTQLKEYNEVLNETSRELKNLDLTFESLQGLTDKLVKAEGDLKSTEQEKLPLPSLRTKNGIEASTLNAFEKFKVYLKGKILDLGNLNRNNRDYLSQIKMVTGIESFDVEQCWDSKKITGEGLLWQGFELPFAEQSFDAVIGLEILNTCPQPDLLLRELLRVTKPTGSFLFAVPCLYPLNEHDKARYSVYSLTRTLTEAGFTNVEISALGGWHASMAQMLSQWFKYSSLGIGRKKIIGRLINPVIKYLYKLERYTKVELSDNPMVTGLCGVCFKP